MTQCLFLPGMCSDAEQWESQMQMMRERGHAAECLAYNDLDNLPDMAARFSAKVEPGVVVFATSMGGFVLLEALKDPHVRDAISMAVLVNCSYKADTPETRDLRQRQIEACQSEGGAAQDSGYVHGIVGAAARENPAFIDKIYKMHRRQGDKTYINHLKALLMRPDYRNVLEQIPFPTLILAGEEDTLTPPQDSREMAEHIGQGVLQCFSGGGHALSMERPNDVNAIIQRFMEERGRA